LHEDKLLVPLNKHADHSRGIVFVPHAAAGAGAFAALGRVLPVAAWAARFPGRESRITEAPLTSIEAMADELVASVSGLGVDELVLFGHCSGGLVAYEAALRLRQHDAMASRLTLVASSCAAPTWRERPQRNVGEMTEDELIALLVADGGTSPTLVARRDFLELILPVYRADLIAMERYDRGRPPRYLDIPILAIAGKEDEDLPDAAFTAWAQLACGPFEARRLAGDHFYLAGQEQELAEMLQELLEAGTENQVRSAWTRE
jgi:medium-chain acyl-[acyl-carrier-protein] hydrolase